MSQAHHSESITEMISAVYRDEYARVIGALVRLTRDLDLAEECAQDAFVQALDHWVEHGLPPNPGAWLTVVARNRALDRLRRIASERNKLEGIAVMAYNDKHDDASSGDAVSDEVLALICGCCHPALAVDAQIALTLRSVLGMPTATIARALLTSEPTMAQRLVRAKSKIRHSGIPFEVPSGRELSHRLTGILHVLYLVFNEGYDAVGADDVDRAGLCDEAIRLAKLLTKMLPRHAELGGLFALMLLQHARRDARIDEAGNMLTLEVQNRATWDSAMMAKGLAVLDSALRRGEPGPYQIQAAIAACHATAPTFEQTDWAQIVALYGILEQTSPSPIVTLNRAIAISYAEGPEAALPILEHLQNSGALELYHLLAAAQADCLRRLSRNQEAGDQYRRALLKARNEMERKFLTKRLTEIEGTQ